MNTQPEPSVKHESGGKPAQQKRTWLTWLGVFVGIMIVLLFREKLAGPAELISQFRFEQLVDADQIKRATITYSSQNPALNEVTGIYLRTAENGSKTEIPFRAKVRLTPSLEEKILSRPQFEPYEPNTMLLSVAVSVLPFVVIATLIWFFFIRQIRKVSKEAQATGNPQMRTVQQQDRFDQILAKWEEQARRMDVVLDRMEQPPGTRQENP